MEPVEFEILKQNLISKGIVLDEHGKVKDVTHEFLLNKINELEYRVKELELKNAKDT